MPSPRRLRLLLLAAIVTVVVIFFYSSGLNGPGKESRVIQDFYHKTMDGMSKGGGGGGTSPGQAIIDSVTGHKAGHIPADKDADGDIDDDDKWASAKTKERLKQAEQKAKDQANEKALRPDPPSQVIGKGNSADGQVKVKGGSANKGSSSSGKDATSKETKEEHDAEVEMNAILKKAPVVIFSKTYCPYSKRAKGILLEKYTISPAPYVVELDEHPLGKQLQDQLKVRTDRKTVPNILVNGVSLGGSDEIVDLDNADRLAAKIRDLGNKRVEISERFSAGSRQA